MRKTFILFLFFVSFLILFFLILLLSVNFVSAGEIRVDFKTTRVMVEVDENGNAEAGHILGTITNYKENYTKMNVEVNIISDGTLPKEAKGSGYYIEVFGTKAIFYLENFTVGKTKDFVVQIEITDIKISKIEFNVSVMAKNETNNNFTEIYKDIQKRKIPINLYDKGVVNPYHSVIAVIGNYYYGTENEYSKIDITIKNEGDFYENDIVINVIVRDENNKWIRTYPMEVSLNLPPKTSQKISVSFDDRNAQIITLEVVGGNDDNYIYTKDTIGDEPVPDNRWVTCIGIFIVFGIPAIVIGFLLLRR